MSYDAEVWCSDLPTNQEIAEQMAVTALGRPGDESQIAWRLHEAAKVLDAIAAIRGARAEASAS